jgi:hypothetical protein
MSWKLVVFLAAILLIVLAMTAAKKRPAGSVGFPYTSRNPLLPAAKRSFLGVLDKAVGSEHSLSVQPLAAVKPHNSFHAQHYFLSELSMSLKYPPSNQVIKTN